MADAIKAQKLAAARKRVGGIAVYKMQSCTIFSCP